jgi:hypothetical protein
MYRLLFCLMISCLALFWPSWVKANEFEQVWNCKLQSGKSLDEIRAVARGWLLAAHSMSEGDKLQLEIRWPIAVADSADAFEFVIRAPSLKAWGSFYDGYDPSSPVGKADEVFASIASCSGSTLWESIAIEAGPHGSAPN